MRATSPYHHPWYHHYNIRQAVQALKLLITKFSPISYYRYLLRSQHFLQHLGTWQCMASIGNVKRISQRSSEVLWMAGLHGMWVVAGHKGRETLPCETASVPMSRTIRGWTSHIKLWFLMKQGLDRQSGYDDAPSSGDINYSSSHGSSHVLISWFLILWAAHFNRTDVMRIRYLE